MKRRLTPRSSGSPSGWVVTVYAVVFALSLVASLARAATAQAPTAASPAPVEDIALSNDARLKVRVTVERRRIYLEELLEELSGKTGVRLEISDSGGVGSGIPLVIFARATPASTLLVGLRELLTHPQIRWSWSAIRGPVGAQVGYRLSHSPTFGEAVSQHRSMALSRWMRDLEWIRSAAADPRWPELARDRADLIPNPTPRWLLPFQALATLTSQDFGRLKGGKPIAIPWSSLPTTLRSGLQKAFFAQPPRGNAGPTALRFGLDLKQGPRRATPVLQFEIRAKSGPVHFTELLGGNRWERAFRRGFGSRWQDDSTASLAPTPVGPTRSLSRSIELAYRKHGGVWLCDDLLARWNTPARTEPPAASATATLGRLARSGNLHYLTLGSTHLLRPAETEHQMRNQTVPWSEIRSLRTACDRTGGVFALDSLVHLGAMQREQRHGLADEFPALRGPDSDALSTLAEWLARVSSADRASLTGSEGLRLTEPLLRSMRPILGSPAQTRIRLGASHLTAGVTVRIAPPTADRHYLRWELLGPDGRRITATRLSCPPKPKPPS